MERVLELGQPIVIGWVPRLEDFHLKPCLEGPHESEDFREQHSIWHPLNPFQIGILGLKIHGFVLQRLKTSINNSWGHSLHLLSTAFQTNALREVHTVIDEEPP